MSEVPDPVYSFRSKMSQVLCLLLDIRPGNELMVVGTQEGFIHVWDLKTKRELSKLQVADVPCISIIKLIEGYATLSKGKEIKIWSPKWDLLNSVPTDYVGFCNLEFNGNILVPESDGRIVVTTVNGTKLSDIEYKPKKKHGELMCMKAISSLVIVIACYESGLIALWNLDGTVLDETLIDDTPMCLDFNVNNCELTIGTSGSCLFLYSVSENILKLKCKTEITNPGISSLSIRNDGKLCVASCWDSNLRYFSMKTLRLLAVLDNVSVPNCVAFSQQELNSFNAGFVFVGGADGSINIWNLYCDNK